MDDSDDLRILHKHNIKNLKKSLLATLCLSSEILAIECDGSLKEQSELISDVVEDALEIALRLHAVNYYSENTQLQIQEFIEKHPEMKKHEPVFWGMAIKRLEDIKAKLH